MFSQQLDQYYLIRPEAFDLEEPCSFDQGPITLMQLHRGDAHLFPAMHLRNLCFLPRLSAALEEDPVLDYMVTYAMTRSDGSPAAPYIRALVQLKGAVRIAIDSDGNRTQFDHQYPACWIHQIVCADDPAALATDIHAVSDAHYEPPKTSRPGRPGVIMPPHNPNGPGYVERTNV